MKKLPPSLANLQFWEKKIITTFTSKIVTWTIKNHPGKWSNVESIENLSLPKLFVQILQLNLVICFSECYIMESENVQVSRIIFSRLCNCSIVTHALKYKFGINSRMTAAKWAVCDIPTLLRCVLDVAVHQWQLKAVCLKLKPVKENAFLDI